MKHPDDIYSKRTLNSIKGKPVTDGHPSEPVTKKNIKQYMKGTTHTDVRVEDTLVITDETIFDDGLIEGILTGEKRQVSIGFQTELIPEKGTYNGMAYDYRQTNILVNHIAHVPQGRAGEEVGVRMDSNDAQMIYDQEESKDKPEENVNDNDENINDLNTDNGGDEMADKVKVKIDGITTELEVPEEVKQKLDELNTKVDELEATKEKLDSANEQIEELKAEKDAKQGEIDALQKKLDDSAGEETYTKDQVDTMIKDRLELIKTASQYIKDFDDTGKTDQDIKVEIIKKADEEFTPEGKSDEYINARYDATIAILSKGGFKSVGSKNLKHVDKADNVDALTEKRQKRLSLKK